MKNQFHYIDLSYILEASSKPEFVKKILSVFDREFSELKNDIQSQVKTKDYESLKKTMHKAKSSVLITSVKNGRETIMEAESLLKAGKEKGQWLPVLEKFYKLCEQANQEFKLVLDDLNSKLI